MPSGKGSRRQAQQEPASLLLLELPRSWLRALVLHLDPGGKLCLFKASKQLAALVLQDAGAVQLAPNQPYCFDVQRRQQALNSLLATAADCHLHVVLRWLRPDYRAEVYASLPLERMTRLRLEDAMLHAKTLQQKLQLRECTHLHTLSLRSWGTDMSAADIIRLQQQQQHDWLPPALTSLEVGKCGRRNDSQEDSFAALLLQLLGPQLTSLAWDMPVKQPALSQLARMTQLTQFSTSQGVTDTLMDVLLRLPRLVRVSAGSLSLQQPANSHPSSSHRPAACTWQQLELETSSIQGLASMPLQHVQRVVLHGGVRLRGLDAQAALTSLHACPGLQYTPAANKQLQQPVLSLHDTCHPDIINLCASRLTARNVCIRFATAPAREQLPAWLPQLPASVTALWLPTSQAAGPTCTPTAQREQYWQQLVAALPRHVTQLVLDTFNCGSYKHSRWHATSLLSALDASPQHTLDASPQHNGVVQVALALVSNTWLKDAQAMLQRMSKAQRTRLRLLPEV